MLDKNVFYKADELFSFIGSYKIAIEKICLLNILRNVKLVADIFNAVNKILSLIFGDDTAHMNA